jgi:hypothetical protein
MTNEEKIDKIKKEVYKYWDFIDSMEYKLENDPINGMSNIGKVGCDTIAKITKILKEER